MTNPRLASSLLFSAFVTAVAAPAAAQSTPPVEAAPPPLAPVAPLAPLPPQPDEVATEWNSKALFWSGFGTGILGSAMLTYGAVRLATLEEPTCDRSPNEAEGFETVGAAVGTAVSCGIGQGLGHAMDETLAISATVVGSLAVATAIPLMIAGAWPVPVDSDDPAVPEVAIGPSSAQLTWSF